MVVEHVPSIGLPLPYHVELVMHVLLCEWLNSTFMTVKYDLYVL